MSRSNPTDGTRNPASRWYEWAGGADGGFVRWYDKEAETSQKADGTFTFLVLDELSTVKGWHEPSGSSIYANEVRDTRQDVLVVRSFKGGEIASGMYADIKDRVKAYGGHYHSSIYIATKIDGQLRLANLGLKGAAAGAWMEFKKGSGTKANSEGKAARAYMVDAVKIDGFSQEKKGGTIYRIPKFALVPVSKETDAAALALDAELQAFLSDYLRRPKAEAGPAKPNGDHEYTDNPDSEGPPTVVDDFKDDVPF